MYFEPGPIQIASVSPSVGTPAQGPGSTVLTATSLTPIVTVDLDVSQEYLVKPGDAVTVVLPDGVTTVGGRIATVGTVATCPGGAVPVPEAAAGRRASPAGLATRRRPP